MGFEEGQSRLYRPCDAFVDAQFIEICALHFGEHVLISKTGKIPDRIGNAIGKHIPHGLRIHLDIPRTRTQGCH